MKITIVHCLKASQEGNATLYCGRGKAPRNWQVAMGLGNPFSVAQHGRGGCIAKYEHALDSGALPEHSTRITKIALRIKKQDYTHIQLSCWCAPKPCHCDVIRRHILNTK